MNRYNPGNLTETPRVCCHCAVLETEVKLIEAAQRNDVQAMKVWGRGVNVNVKNVVSVQSLL